MIASLQQFTLYWCNLEPTFGHQIKKIRPCVIVSPDEVNEVLGTVVVVPLTGNLRNFPFRIPVHYRDRPGVLACDQIKTIDKRRVGKVIAKLTDKDTVTLSETLCGLFSGPNEKAH